MTQPSPYSHGSILAQFVHMINADWVWFSELNGEEPDLREAAEFDGKEALYLYWKKIEAYMRAYLANLADSHLFSKPIQLEEDENLLVWQVLLHVINHATDHRAQILRSLYDLGIQTQWQDFIFYTYDHPM